MIGRYSTENRMKITLFSRHYLRLHRSKFTQGTLSQSMADYLWNPCIHDTHKIAALTLRINNVHLTVLLPRPVQKRFSVRVNTAIPNQAYLPLYLIVSQPLPTMTMDVLQDDEKIPSVMQGCQQAESIYIQEFYRYKKKKTKILFQYHDFYTLYFNSSTCDIRPSLHVRICLIIRKASAWRKDVTRLFFGSVHTSNTYVFYSDKKIWTRNKPE